MMPLPHTALQLGSASPSHNPLHAKLGGPHTTLRPGELPKVAFVERFWPMVKKHYESMLHDIKEYCKNQLDESGVSAKLEGRVKTSSSIAASLDRREQARIGMGEGGLTTIGQIIHEMHDLVGIRIILDYPTDLKTAEVFIKRTFKNVKEPNHVKRDRLVGKMWDTWFGAYQCSNYRVTLSPQASDSLSEYHNVMFEVQLTTLPESLYNRLAHPLLYKETGGDLSRKDELVIDMAHGLALCSSLCDLYFQDQLGASSKRSRGTQHLEAMRQAGLQRGDVPVDGDMDTLTSLTPGHVLDGSQGSNGNSLKRRASFGNKVPVESFMQLLENSPEDCDSRQALWSTFTEKIRLWDLSVNKMEVAVNNQTAQMQKLLTLQLDEKDKVCLRDLCVINPKQHKTTIQATKGGLLKEAYRWILQNDEFLRFKNDTESRLLWIKGNPGKGKTMLLCGIIDHLEESEAVVYFFCQATQGEHSRSAAAVLRSLIWMLCNRYPGLMCHVRKKYDSEGKEMFDNFCAVSALKEILSDVLCDPRLGQTYLIIDALDECSDKTRSEMISAIIELSALPASSGRWIVSSRNWLEIEEQFQFSERVQVSLELNHESISAAVGIFIQSQVEHLSRVKAYDADTKQRILTGLTEKAQDTFLWVALVCQELHKTPKWAAVKKLQLIPVGLGELYERMMGQIASSDSADVCMRVLAATCTAFRLVTVDELAVLAKDLDDLERQHLTEVIKECGSFLTVQEGVVYFVHQSARDFLDKHADKVFLSGLPDRHRGAFEQSLDSLMGLSKDMYDLKFPGVDIKDVGRPEPDPLSGLEYSCVYWVDHFAEIKPDCRIPSDYERIEQFIRCKLLNWLEALSLREKMAEGTRAVRKLGSILQNEQCHDLGKLSADVQRFVLYFRPVLGTAPLQIYTAAPTFTPTGSLVGKILEEEPKWARMTPEAKDWDPSIQTFEGHGGVILCLEFSGDGQRLASASWDETVRVWDVSSGNCIQVIDAASKVRTVALSANGQRLALGTVDGSIQVWDAEFWSRIHLIDGHPGNVNAVVFSPDGKALASSCSYDGTIKMWHAETAKLTRTMDAKSQVYSISFSADGRQLASSGDKKVRVWDAVTGECLWALIGHELITTSVAFSPFDLRVLVSGSQDRAIRIWDTRDGTCTHKLAPESGVTSLVFLGPDHGQHFLASASYNHGGISLWDKAGAPTQFSTSHHGPVRSLAYSPNKHVLASGSEDKTVKLWDLTKIPQQNAENVRQKHTRIRSVAFSHNGQLAASCLWDGTITVWDSANPSSIRTSQSMAESGHESLHFSANGQWLVLDKLGSVEVWDAASLNCIYTRQDLKTLAFYSVGNLLGMVFSDEPTTEVLDMASRTPIITLPVFSLHVAFSPDANKIAVVRDLYNAKYEIQVRVIKTGNKIFTYPHIRGVRIYSTTFSSDSQLVAFHDKSTIFVLNMAGDLLYKISDAKRGYLNATCLALNGRYLALYDPNVGRLFIWNLHNSSKRPMELRLSLTGPMKFHPGNDTELITDFGVICIEHMESQAELDDSNVEPIYSGYGISSDGAWVIYGSKRLFWLPSGYRSRFLRVTGSTITMLTISNTVITLMVDGMEDILGR